MDIRDYEYIVAIAEQGSITRAASILFITQSALTKYLQRKEKELGIQLFVRKGNQFTLTEAGKQYVDAGRQIMQLDRKLTQQLSRTLNQQKKQIRLGYGMGKSDYIIGEILPEFYKKYPEIRVSAVAETSSRQMIHLENNELDLALVSNQERVSGYRYLPVGKSNLALAVRADSDLAARAVVTEGYPHPAIDKRELEGLPMVILSIATASGKLVRDICKNQDIHPNITAELSDVRSLMDAVESGLGAALYLSVPVGKRNLCYLSVKGVETPEQVTSLVFKDDKNLSKAMEYMIRLFQKER